jgi:MFS family permease
VISVIMVFGITLGLTIPLIAIVLDGQGHSSVAIGLHASTQFLGIMLAALITPRLLVAVGTSRLMVLSMVAMMLIFCAFPFFMGFVPWLLLRLLLGGVEGIIFISAETWISQVAPSARRGRVIGIYGTLLAGGIAAGPLLLELTGVEGVIPFLTGAVLTFVSLSILLFAPHVAPSIRDATRRSPWTIAKTVPIAVASVMLFGFLDAAAFWFIPN